MRDIILIMLLPLTMLLGWILTEGTTEEDVITTSDCIAQKRDEWRQHNRYPGKDEWRKFRDQCWAEMGATVNDVADL
jgi:hypothetical protein